MAGLGAKFVALRLHRRRGRRKFVDELTLLALQREVFEAKQMDLLTSAYSKELAEAKVRISDTIGKAMCSVESPGKYKAMRLVLGSRSRFFCICGQGDDSVSFAALIGGKDDSMLKLEVNVLPATAATDELVTDAISLLERGRADKADGHRLNM